MPTPPILITGCARSGTSMTAGILSLCGAWKGVTNGPNPNNKKGMFENGQIRNALVKPYLGSHETSDGVQVDPMGQNPLPVIDELRPDPGWRAKILMIMRAQGLVEDTPWMYKGAKMCLMWPIWHAAFPDAQWLIVRRGDTDIVNSCMRTGFMRKRKTEASWQEWVDHHKMMFEQMRAAGLNMLEVWPTKFIGGDFTEIQAAVDQYGLEWNEQGAREFVDPRLFTEEVTSGF